MSEKLLQKKRQLNDIADMVAQSMTPHGKSVAFYTENGYVISTKDGLTILKGLVRKDPYEQMLITLLRDGANSQVNYGGGDGTSSVVVMAISMWEEMLKGNKKLDWINGFRDCVSETVKHIDAGKYKIKTTERKLKAMAMTTANQNEEIAELTVEAFKQLQGEELPTVIISPNKFGLEVTEGMTIPAGYMLQAFVNQPGRGRCILNNPLVLAVEKINSINQATVQEHITKASQDQRPLVIFVGEIDPANLRTILEIHLNQDVVFDCCIVELKHRGPRLIQLINDIKYRCQCKNPMSHTMPNEVEDMGTLKKLVVNQEQASLIPEDDDSKEFLDYVKSIECLEIPPEDETWRQTRLDRMSSKLVTVGIDAPTAVAKEHARHLLEDTVLAYEKALTDGLNPGFGISYILNAPGKLDGTNNCTKDYMEGWNSFIDVCAKSIMKQCIKNCRAKLDIDILIKSKSIYDATKNDVIPISKCKVIEAATTTKQVLISAFDVAQTLSNIETLEVHPKWL